MQATRYTNRRYRQARQQIYRFIALFQIMLLMVTPLGVSAAPPSANTHSARPTSPLQQETPTEGNNIDALLSPTVNSRMYSEDRLIVRFDVDTGRNATAVDAVHAGLGARVLFGFPGFVNGLQVAALPAHVSVEEAIDYYKNMPGVLYAEPDYVVSIQQEATNDPYFTDGRLWGLTNVDAGINIADAWKRTRGSRNVVVAVSDTGIDYNHEDLQANMWRNLKECSGVAGQDDDNNGVVDDCYGFDAIEQDGDPKNKVPGESHGTHVAGTIGAVGNNGKGIVGVNHSVSIMALRVLNEQGSGYTSGILQGWEYAAKMKRDHNVDVVAINASLGGSRIPTQAEQDAAKSLMDAGILLIVAAGNEANNNSYAAKSPANLDLPNVITVAASDNRNQVASFSNTGQGKVHIAAPGVDIWSTVPTGNSDGLYASYNGTSMATPHVTGVAALLKAQDPNRTWWQIKNLILAGGDNLANWQGLTTTGKRLNANRSLTCIDSTAFGILAPAGAVVEQPFGNDDTILLSAINVRCANPAGAVTVTVKDSSGTTVGTVTLVDDGQSPDHYAGDGVYSGRFSPLKADRYEFVFSNGNTQKTVQHVAWKSYLISEINHNGFTLSNSARTLSLTGLNGVLSAPFAFHIAGREYPVDTPLNISLKGKIAIEGPAGGDDFSTPHSQAYTLLSPFALQIGTPEGEIRYEILGTAPDRQLVVEWHNLKINGVCDAVSFQVALFENKSDVLYHYTDPIISGGEAPIGGFCASWSAGADQLVSLQAAPGNVATYLPVPSYFNKNPARLRAGQTLLFRVGGAEASDIAAGLTLGSSVAYALSITPYAWRSLPDNATAIPFGNDATQDFERAVPLPPDFNFAPLGVPVRNLWISRFGWVSSRPTENVAKASTPRVLPMDDGFFLAALWDSDIAYSANFDSSIRYGVLGSAPNREFVVEWRKMQRCDAENFAYGEGTYQAVLREGTHEIFTNYQDLTFAEGCASNNGGTAAVGLQINGDAATMFNYAQQTNRAELYVRARDGQLADGVSLYFAPASLSSNPGTAPATVLLRISKQGSGAGVITSAPGGINCGADCLAEFNRNTPVTLTATPTQGSIFTGWQGTCSGAGSCQVVLSGETQVTAQFDKVQTLTVTRNGSGSGTVSSTPAGINCGATCSAPFGKDAEITLTAAASTGSIFQGWSGACEGNAQSCTVRLSNDQSVIATFTPESSGDGCFTYTSEDVGRAIPDDGTATLSSVVRVPGSISGLVQRVEVLNLKGSHDWINDLQVKLVSPTGNEAMLFSKICSSEDNFNINFADGADKANNALPCPPTDGGTYQPKDALSVFGNQRAAGEWQLVIEDSYADGNIGNQLEMWSLKLCIVDAPPTAKPETLPVAQVCIDAANNAERTSFLFPVMDLLPTYSNGIAGPGGLVAAAQTMRPNIETRLTLHSENVAYAQHLSNRTAARTQTIEPSLIANGLSGVVRTPDGAPVPSAWVWAETVDGKSFDFADADEDGAYAFTNLGDGDWLLQAYPPEGDPDYATFAASALVEVTLPGTSNLDLTLLTPKVFGTVLLPDDTPFEYPLGILYATDGDEIDFADARYADGTAEGVFAFGDVPTGGYQLEIELFSDVYNNPAPVSVTVADAPVDLGAIYARVNPKQIVGKVQDTQGNPIGDASVDAWSEEGYFFTETDSDGNFNLRVTGGEWEVEIYPMPEDGTAATWVYSGGPKIVAFKKDESLEQSSMLTFNVEAPAGYIRGRLMQPNGSAFTPTETFSAFVDVWNDESGFYTYSEVAADGRFAVAVPMGSFAVSPWLDPSIYKNLIATALPPVSIKDGDVDLGQIHLVERNVTIRGVVTSKAGRPIPGVWVDVWQPGGFWDYTSTDEQGRYTIAVAPGEWHIQAIPDDGTEGEQSYLPTDDTYKVRVNANQTLEQNFQLAPAVGTASVRVQVNRTATASTVESDPSDRRFNYFFPTSAPLPTIDQTIFYILEAVEMPILVGPDDYFNYTPFRRDNETVSSERSATSVNASFRFADEDGRLQFRSGQNQMTRAGRAVGVTATTGTNLDLQMEVFIDPQKLILEVRCDDGTPCIQGDISIALAPVGSMSGPQVHKVGAPVPATNGAIEMTVPSGVYGLPAATAIMHKTGVGPTVQTGVILWNDATVTVSNGGANTTIGTAYAYDTIIVGQATTSGGTPLADAQVSVTLLPTSGAIGTLLVVNCGITADDGSYNCKVPAFFVSQGYQLSIFPAAGSGLAPVVQSVAPAVANQRMADAPRVVSAQVDRKLVGQAFLEDGKTPLVNAWVTATNANGQSVAARTDSNGCYILSIAAADDKTWNVKGAYEESGSRRYYAGEITVTDNTTQPGTLVLAQENLRLTPRAETPKATTHRFQNKVGANIVLPGGLQVMIPPNAINTTADNLQLVYTPNTSQPDSSILSKIDIGYKLQLQDTASGRAIESNFRHPVTVKFRYTDEDLRRLGVEDESWLFPAYYSSRYNMWITLYTASHDTDNNMFVAQLDHFSDWGIVGIPASAEERRLFLPSIQR
ncbi:S8 family serine peptidase [bacterium]|nr:S8 family serine peptidase [bacterium]